MAIELIEKRFILLAEDDQDIRELIRDSIQLQSASGAIDYEVVEAVDGADAISKASQRQFHCVVTDLKMPNSSGEEFIKAMQAHPLNASTPTLVISGHAHEEFSEFCDRYSHIKVFPKPFEPNAIAQAVVRELRLGRIDERVPLHLLNPFLDAIQLTCRTELSAIVQMDQPVVKKVGDPLPGEIFCALNIASQVNKARLHLGFTNEFIELIRSAQFFQAKTLNWQTMLPEAIVRLFITEIFERSASALKDRMGGTTRFTGLSIFQAKGSPESSEMLNASGVTVLIRTDKGLVSAGAFARPKTKRLVA